jgi:hypothetical protein
LTLKAEANVGIFDSLFKKTGDQERVIFNTTEPGNLSQRTAVLNKALKSLPVLKENSLRKFRGGESRSGICKTVNLEEASESVFKLITNQVIQFNYQGLNRFEVKCEYGHPADWGDKQVISMPLTRIFDNGQADFLPHMIGRVEADQFEIWHS